MNSLYSDPNEAAFIKDIKERRKKIYGEAATDLREAGIWEYYIFIPLPLLIEYYIKILCGKSDADMGKILNSRLDQEAMEMEMDRNKLWIEFRNKYC